MSTYIFDFDGTLGDSMPYFKEGMLELLNKNNIPYTDELVKIITPLGYGGTAKYFIEEYRLPYTMQEIVEQMHEYLYPVYRDQIVLKPAVADCLHKLKAQGHSLNVLTASPYRMVAPVLKRGGVYELFDNVWSCEDFQRTKGEPEIYVEAVERAGGSMEDAVFLDDNLEALRIAASTGIYTVGVYDDASGAYVEDIKQIVNKYIYSFDEL